MSSKMQGVAASMARRYTVRHLSAPRSRDGLIETIAHAPAKTRAQQKSQRSLAGLFVVLVRPEGFEPPTPKFVAWCSIQLSYGRLEQKRNFLAKRLLRQPLSRIFLCDFRGNQIEFEQWRRVRDSNPRWSFKPHTPLAGEPLQPLGQLSEATRSTQAPNAVRRITAQGVCGKSSCTSALSPSRWMR